MTGRTIIKNYWSDIDQRIEKLCSEGSVKLPSLKGFNLHKVANDISKEMGNTTEMAPIAKSPLGIYCPTKKVSTINWCGEAMI